MKRAALTAWLYVLTAVWAGGASAALAQTSTSGLTDPVTAYKAWKLCARLVKGTRIRFTLEELEELMRGAGVPLDTDATARVYEALDRLEQRHKPSEIAAAKNVLAMGIGAVASQVFKAMPDLIAADVPDDDGGALFIFLKLPKPAKRIEIYRRDVTRDKPWRKLRQGIVPENGLLKPGPYAYVDQDLLRPNREYQYEVRYVDASGQTHALGRTQVVRAAGNWYNWSRNSLFWVVLILSAVVLTFIWMARRGVELKIRTIAGLEAVDEAVGRATEMGRPIMFIPGIQDMNDIQTIAGLTVLGRVARVAAERDALLEVPTARSLVMTAARETVHSSFLDAGRPDAYDEKRIYYTTDEQFGYVAAVTGAMVREKPATCFYMGAFYAESLILAETANATGSIQIAGTAMPAQLPFFVAACDYTLIGEEFFAASAYLSGEPQQLGSLKGQDAGKIFGLILILLGVASATLFKTTHADWFERATDFMAHSVLETAEQ